LSGENWNPLYFDIVFVPEKQVLLGWGGFKKQISGFNVERIGNSARALALGRYAYELAREHALTRRQFGKLLCEFQGLQWKFANLKIALDAAQLLLYRAAVSADRGFPSAGETAIAKVMCNRAGFDAANEAMQILGGGGYTEDTLVEYCFRRTRWWMIAGGTIEILLNRIAEDLFERSFSRKEHKEPT
jgi:alkylation response protein AidB-like acyl-CoA dehydrogenase